MRKKYSFSFSNKVDNTKYNKASKGITTKIKIWNKQIKAIDKKSKEVARLYRIVAQFVGYGFIRRRVRGEHKIGKAIYYKYGMESGMQAIDLRQYIGMSREGQPWQYRIWFNKSFDTNPEYRDIWNRFKQYIEQYK